jgi:hypothetical protein
VLPHFLIWFYPESCLPEYCATNSQIIHAGCWGALHIPHSQHFSPYYAYSCSDCTEKKIHHEVQQDIPGPPTDSRSNWGSGLSTTMRRCTGCQHEDGPWVSAKLVGGYW